MEAIDKCLLDHAAAAGTKEGGPEILDVYFLRGLSETHYYLKVEHDFKPDEVDALLQFSDPLIVARECWEERNPENGFPICDLLEKIKAYERFPLVDPTEFARQQADKVDTLKAVLDQNMTEFHASLLDLDKEAIIAQSEKIAAMQAAHAYMVNDFSFRPGDADTLLRMENPLQFIAKQWPFDVDGLVDMQDLVGEVILDAKGKMPQCSQEVTEGKPSVLGQLHEKMREVGQRPPVVDRAKGGEPR